MWQERGQGIVFVTIDGGRYVATEGFETPMFRPLTAPEAAWAPPLAHTLLTVRELKRLEGSKSIDGKPTEVLEQAKTRFDACAEKHWAARKAQVTASAAPPPNSWSDSAARR